MAAQVKQICKEGFSDLGFAKVDTSRAARTGIGEVVYGSGKNAKQIASICEALSSSGQTCVLVTRLSPKKATKVKRKLKAKQLKFHYDRNSKLGICGKKPTPTSSAYIVVACAGTSDLYCAEEAATTAEVLGTRVVRLFDVGVAGIHRLLAHKEEIANAVCIVAVAGMDGALPSVIAGISPAPVIAVPTSVGYGASFKGLSALLAMLNSCGSGVSVVNIDNGFGAGFQAHLIANQTVCPTATNGKVLSLNLTQSATRNQILSSILLQLPGGSFENLLESAKAAGIPNAHHHNIHEVNKTICNLKISEDVRNHMLQIYDILANAEACAHGVDVCETHFHEVGEGKRILNTLVICLAIEQLAPKKIVSTPVQTGMGKIKCAHGELEIPAPATKAIVERGIPTCKTKLAGELLTPTSAAIILHYVDEFIDGEFV